MPRLAIGEYRPDLSDNLSPYTRTLLNVLPRSDGYGPFPDIARFTSALPAACRGYFYARNSDGSITVFAGTATKLYKLSNTDFTWSDVSKGGSAYSALPNADQWQFVQFNSLVFATQIGTVLQVFNLSSPSAFADAAGSPPQARYISVVGRFLVLTGIQNQASRVQWSGLNNVNASTSWDNVTLQSNYQDLPDGGLVRGVGGGESGLITQDAALRRMTYVPGNPVVFQFDRISEEKGIFAPISLTRSGDRLFWLGVDGLKMLAPGGNPQPIGKDRVDTTLFADMDQSALQLCIGASDPSATRWYLAYKSKAGQTGRFDKMLCYDWAIDRFTPIAVNGEYLASLAKPGLTLESLDAIAPGGSLDALTFSLDDISSAAAAQLSIINTSHILGFFSGSNLEAIIETAEQVIDTEGHRVFIRGFRPITDAPSLYGSISQRSNLQAAATYTGENALNVHGICPVRRSTRYVRARLRIPAGLSWTNIQAIEPDFVREGGR